MLVAKEPPAQVLLSAQHVDMVLSFTKIDGEKTKKALHLFFVDGMRQCDILVALDIKQSFLCRKISDFNDLNARLAESSRFYPPL